MNWEKEYIIQTYENAAENLRLVSKRLINHTLIKEFLTECAELERAVSEMKKITAFAKFAIKLGNVIEYTHSVPNFAELSAEMTKQVNELIPIVREVFDDFDPDDLAEKLNVLRGELSHPEKAQSENDFAESALEILNLIRSVDEYLNLCVTGNISSDDKENFMEIVNRINALLESFDDPLISEMKNIFNELFGEIIARGSSRPDEIEAMRACLIVIVAKLKKKEVDVSQFIELARSITSRKEEG